MPVPYPPPDKLPVKVCEIPSCPYRRRATRDGRRVCQQHQRMWDNHNRFTLSLNLASVELRYTRAGYPEKGGKP